MDIQIEFVMPDVLVEESITLLLKMKNRTWKYAWMQRSQGTTDMKTWE